MLLGTPPEHLALRQPGERFTLARVRCGAGRVLAGVACGAASLYVPRYLSEIAPVAIRGGISTLNQACPSVCMPSPTRSSLTVKARCLVRCH